MGVEVNIDADDYMQARAQEANIAIGDLLHALREWQAEQKAALKHHPLVCAHCGHALTPGVNEVTKEQTPQDANEGTIGPRSTTELGIWTRPRPPLFHLCTLDVYQTDRPLNQGVWEIIGFDAMDSEHEVFILRRFSPAEPSGPTGEQYRVWRAVYEAGHMHIWRRGLDLLDPRFLMPNALAKGPASADPA